MLPVSDLRICSDRRIRLYRHLKNELIYSRDAGAKSPFKEDLTKSS